jgi:propionate CoA-transferase
MPAGGLSFGCSAHPEAIIDQPAQFDFYDGGGLDVAVLGAVTIDAEGSVNISALGDRFAGVGGFVNIAQNARKVVFCCPLRAGGLAVVVTDGQLQIQTEGRHCKFVKGIPQVAFHGPSARARGQEVYYITERAVFRLGDHGLDLTEIAPGIDMENDICTQMEFRPNIADPKAMPAECFRED